MWGFLKPKEEKIKWYGYGKYQYCKKCKKVFGPSRFDVELDGICGKCGNELTFVVARFKVNKISEWRAEVLDVEIKKYLKR